MVESTITSRGQTTLPKSVREALGVRPGDRVRYVVSGDEVRITPVRPLARLFGALKHDGPPVTLEEMTDVGYFPTIFGALKGTVTIAPGVDLTAPVEAERDAAR